jgi:tetratricopeptide (TPR) repeat protein
MEILRNRHARAGSTKAIAAILLASIVIAGCTTPWDYHQAGIHMNLGMAYISANQYTPALKELLEANKYTPYDARIHFYLGVAYHGNGMDDKAIASFRKAIALKPDYSDAHNNLGIIYINAGQLDMAIDSFNRALDNMLYETPANALNNLGRAYDQKGDYGMSLKKYEEALRREPNTVLAPIIFNNMGVANLKMDRVEEAIQNFKRALTMVPDYAEAQYWMAECLARKKNYGEARAQFQSLVEAAPESEFGLKAQKRLNALKEMK